MVYRNGNKEILNKQAGHLVRSKVADSDEGGVAAGYGVLDSPYLTWSPGLTIYSTVCICHDLDEKRQDFLLLKVRLVQTTCYRFSFKKRTWMCIPSKVLPVSERCGYLCSDTCNSQSCHHVLESNLNLMSNVNVLWSSLLYDDRVLHTFYLTLSCLRMTGENQYCSKCGIEGNLM